MEGGRRKVEGGRWKVEGGRRTTDDGTVYATTRRMEKPWDLRERTILFALSVIRFCRSLPSNRESAEIESQLRRAGSSIGAHYCAATRNKSDDDYISKIGGAIEEGDETMFWLDLLSRADIAAEAIVKPLRAEANELVSILIACRTTAVERRTKAKKRSHGN